MAKKTNENESLTGMDSKKKSSDNFPIVGIGASAGGLEALKQLFQSLPAEPGISIVVIQHLAPDQKSHTAELLGNQTAMNVSQLKNDVSAEVNQVYVIPPNRQLTIKDGMLRLAKLEVTRGVRTPIDVFLRSLAVDQHDRAIAVILSGTGSDGTLGCKAVKTNGGVVIAQQPETAAHPGMPTSVIETGVACQVLAPDKIPETLVALANHEFVLTEPDLSEESFNRDDDQDGLTAILALLRTQGSFDFRSYKPATLIRRTQRRMGLAGINSLLGYRDHLHENDAEVQALKNDLLISVTDFFRDADAWQTLEENAVRPIVKSKGLDDSVRAWVPGCATGEEAYSVAMVINEQLTAFQKNCPVQVFASDVDRQALDYARQARYPQTITTDVSADRLQTFFHEVEDDHHFHLKKKIREDVVFAEQNLVGDPPFSNLDLICCRNLMIYLKTEIQQKLIALFHFALREGGYLFLGNAETIGHFDDLFEEVSKKWRIYRRIGATRHGIVDFPVAGNVVHRKIEPGPLPKKRRETRLAHLAQQRLIDWMAPRAVLIDRHWQILYYSGDTDAYLTHAPGSPTQDVLAKCRQGLRTKLRAVVQKVLKENGTISVKARVNRDGQFHPVQITVRQIHDSENDEILILILFDEKTNRSSSGSALGASQDTLAESKQNPNANESGYDNDSDTQFDTDEIVRQLEEELNETKEDLRTTIEQLEASNEEFKASSEEVMSINEELQSTNEELETSKEELQSLNEELSTVNGQLANKVEDLESSNNDLNNLIRSTEIPTICLDRDFKIKWFTPATSDLMHIVQTDVGRPLANFSNKLANDNLLKDARTVLRRLTPIETEVTVDLSMDESIDDAAEQETDSQQKKNTHSGSSNDWPADEISNVRKKIYLRRISPYRTVDDRIDGVVITLVDITERKRADAFLKAKELADKIIDTVHEPMLVLDPELTVISANKTFFRTFQVAEEETISQPVFKLGNGNWDIAELRQLLEVVLPDNESFEDFEVEQEFAKIGRRVILLNARRIDRHQLILLAITDVTALRDSQRQITERISLLDVLHDIANVSNKAQTVEQAIRESIHRIGQHNHWRLGHAWKLDRESGQFVSTGIWFVHDEWREPDDDESNRGPSSHTSEESGQPAKPPNSHESGYEDDDTLPPNGAIKVFQQRTMNTRFSHDEGFVGRAIQSGEPQWIEDIEQFEDWRRGDANQLGLHAAAAFNVVVNSEVVAVLEFFSDRVMSREPRFVEIMSNVGVHLGHVVERKRLEKMVADAVSDQQRQFGRELHDSVSQELTGIGMMAESLRHKLSQASLPLVKEAEQLTKHLRGAHDQVTRLSRGLMPVDVDAEGLMTALEELVENINKIHDSNCTFECVEIVALDNNDTATHMYRIAQEAVHNAFKHGQPNEVKVRLARENHDVVLEIIDDGVGMKNKRNPRGSGLGIMLYRANLINAKLDIRPNSKSGVVITCRLPGAGNT